MERRWLEEQLAAGHSLKRIGRLAGKNQSTVSYWLRKYGLRAVHWERCAPKGAVPEDALRELIAAGLPIARVAQALGVSYVEDPILAAALRHADEARRADCCQPAGTNGCVD